VSALSIIKLLVLISTIAVAALQ